MTMDNRTLHLILLFVLLAVLLELYPFTLSTPGNSSKALMMPISSVLGAGSFTGVFLLLLSAIHKSPILSTQNIWRRDAV